VGDRANAWQDDTPLLGALPELDSMAVVTVLTELEERLGIEVPDDEISAETFGTFGSLVAFVESKL
jgi:acyl carrier protein